MKVYILSFDVAFDVHEVVGVYANASLARSAAVQHFESTVPNKMDRFFLGDWKEEGSEVAYLLHKPWAGYYEGGEESDEWYSVEGYEVVER